MAILTVGAGQQYARISDAVAASRDGDTIQVQAGTYVNDFATIGTRIAIVGVGGMVKLQATQPIPNGKAILVTRTDVTLENIEFTGAQVADRNGAGIRYEGGNLVVRSCYFHDNQQGILAAPVPGGTISITRSEFARNGYGDGYTHGVYVNALARLEITDSYFHDTSVGHHIKSRAAETVVSGNRIDDGANGTSSYSIDLPNGGKAYIHDNLIVQAATGQNKGIIAYGGEGNLQANSSLLVENNTIQNFRASATGVVNFTSSVTAVIKGNAFYNLPEVATGPNTQSGNTVLSQPVPVDTSSPWLAPVPAEITGTAGNDVLRGDAADNILRGLGGADSLFGDAGRDTLDGGGGNDSLTGGAGADVLIGGEGRDIALYLGSRAGVQVDLAAGTGRGGDAEGDTFAGVENLYGSAYADILTGDGGVNTLSGGAGADTLSGGAGDDRLAGNAGADWLDGGAGVDIASYVSARAGVSVSLAAGTGSGGDAEGDRLIGIESLSGSDFADMLVGDGGANALEGNGGNDRLDGGAGNDRLTGGTGADTFVFARGYGQDTVTDFRAAQGDKLDLSAFGLGSMAALQAAATITAGTSSVTLDFGQGDRLTVLGLSNLTATAVIL